jgi:hypothetical protein
MKAAQIFRCAHLAVMVMKVSSYPRGDCELETIISALKFITKVLEDGAKEVHD